MHPLSNEFVYKLILLFYHGVIGETNWFDATQLFFLGLVWLLVASEWHT